MRNGGFGARKVATDARRGDPGPSQREAARHGAWHDDDDGIDAPVSPLDALAERLAAFGRPRPPRQDDPTDRLLERLSQTEARTAELLETLMRRSAETEHKTAQLVETLADTAMRRSAEMEQKTARLVETVADTALRRNSESESKAARLVEDVARSARSTEAKTAQALEAVARWIETAERAPRRPEATNESEKRSLEAIRAIGSRLDQLEQRLPKIDKALEAPFRAAIDRLEARLVDMASETRGVAEMPAALNRTATDLDRRLGEVAAKLDRLEEDRKAERREERADHVTRIEEKLSGILETLNTQKSVATGPRPFFGAGHDTLDEAVAEIAARQSRLDESGAEGGYAPQRVPAFDALIDRLGRLEADQKAMRDAIEDTIERTAEPTRDEIGGIRDQLGRLTREIGTWRPSGADEAVAVLKQDIAELTRAVAAMAPTRALGDLSGRISELADRLDASRRDGMPEAVIAPIERLIGDLGRRVAEARPAGLDDLGVELKALSRKIDILAGRGVDSSTVNRLQQQTNDIREALSGLAPATGLDKLARSLDDLTKRFDRFAAERNGQTDATEALARDTAELRATLVRHAPDAAVARVEARIDDLAARLSDRGPKDFDPALIERIARETGQIRAALAEAHTPAAFERLEARLDKLAGKLESATPAGMNELAERIERVHRAIEQTRELATPSGLESFAHAFADIKDRMDDMSRTLDSRQPVSTGPLEAMLGELSKKVERQAPSTAPLEAMLGDLVQKFERAQTSGHDDGALGALERQIGRIAERLDALQANRAPDLSGIERQLGELFARLEGERPTADLAAAPAVQREIEAIKAASDETGRRTREALESVHGMLERVVGRLATIESAAAMPAEAPHEAMREIPRDPPVPAMPAAAGLNLPPIPAPPSAARAEIKVTPRTAAQPAPAVAPSPAVASVSLDELPPARPARPPIDSTLPADFPLEPGSNARVADAAALSAGAKAAPLDPRASFIAAARRAAQAAAQEAGEPGKARPAPASAAKAARIEARPADKAARKAADPASAPAVATGAAPSSLLARVNAIYETRKRPILLGLAALVLMLGTMQIAKNLMPGGEMAASEPVAAEQAAPEAPVDAAPVVEAPVAEAPAEGPVEAVAPTDPAAPPASPEATPPAAGEPATDGEATPGPQSSRDIAPPDTVAAVPSLTGMMAGQREAEVTGSIEPAAGIPAALAAAADKGDARALFDLASRKGLVAGNAADLPAVAGLYRASAEKGFVPAQYRLGSLYEKGLGVKRDPVVARSWYERAAAGGNIKAMHNLAVLFAEGAITGKPDYAKAADWFRAAAQHGLADSQYNLGILSARGMGIAPDLEDAYRWFALAAIQGDADAASKRDDIGRRLEPGLVAGLKKEVETFRPKDAPLTANENTLPTARWERTGAAPEAGV